MGFSDVRGCTQQESIDDVAHHDGRTHPERERRDHPEQHERLSQQPPAGMTQIAEHAEENSAAAPETAYAVVVIVLWSPRQHHAVDALGSGADDSNCQPRSELRGPTFDAQRLRRDSDSIDNWIVKTTIDIPDAELKDAIRFTRARTKREAVVSILVEFNRQRRMSELVKYAGTFSDDFPTNDEIEAVDATPPEHSRARPRR